jgi:uncharacterized protein (UPF0261 family)
VNTHEAAAIAEIHEQDVAEVQALLRHAIRTAGDRWLPLNAIADALARELIVLRGHAPCIVDKVDLNETDPARTIVTWSLVKRS